VLNLGYIRTKLPSAPGQVPEDQWRLADPDELDICHSDLLLNQTDRLVMVRPLAAGALCTGSCGVVHCLGGPWLAHWISPCA
jgi:hypothetical protein